MKVELVPLLSPYDKYMNQILKEKLASLPMLPGCYLMKNKEGEIIYVGKAKRLSIRVNQYFNRPHSGKTQKMVSEIERGSFFALLFGN